MQWVKLVFESLAKSLIRFFDNRFIRDDDVEWYRMELDKQRLETQRIISHILEPKVVTQPVEENEDFVPLNNSTYKPWHLKKRELELASYNKAVELAKAAKLEIEKSKSTAQLEAELLNGTD